MHPDFSPCSLLSEQISDKNELNKKTKTSFFVFLIYSTNLIFINVDSLQTCREMKKKQIIIKPSVLLVRTFQSQRPEDFTFACGDRNVCDQGVEFVGRILILVTLPGKPYAHPVRHVPAQHIRRRRLNSCFKCQTS